MIQNLSSEQIAGILETLPLDISFVDEEDTVKYWNKHDTRSFKRPNSALGRKVQQCHLPASVDMVNQIISVLKSGKKDFEDFWIDLNDRKLYIRYMAVRGKEGKYLGTLEVNQDITDLKKIKGEKRQPE